MECIKKDLWLFVKPVKEKRMFCAIKLIHIILMYINVNVDHKKMIFIKMGRRVKHSLM